MRAVLMAFVAGCWWLQQQAVLPSAWRWWWQALTGAIGVAALTYVVRCRHGDTPVVRRWMWRAAVVALACAAGFGWAAWRADSRMVDWLDPALAGRDIALQGMVAGLPDAASQGTRFLFAVSGSHEARLPPRVLLTWRDPPEALQPGQRYRLTVRLRRPRGLANPYGFDYAYWLLGEGIGATGYVRDGEPQAEAGPLPWAIQVQAWRAGLRDRLRAALPPDARFGAVLVALVIGDQRGIATEDWEVFRRTGISHLVSISGLHITMISGAAGALALGLWRRSFGPGRRLRRPLPLIWPAQQAALVVAILTALGYGLIAGMQVPAMRTVCMLAVAALALWSGRAPPASVVLAWAAGVAVAIDPWAVMSPGFWLSFGAVAAIFLAAREPPQRARAEGRWHRARAAVGATLTGAARTQWAVTVGLVPLTLLLFGQVSVVSCLANAVAIPVVSLLVTPLALAGAVLPVIVARPLLAVAHTTMTWLSDALAWLAAPAWAVWEAAQAGPVWMVLASAGVVFVLMPRERAPDVRAATPLRGARPARPARRTCPAVRAPPRWCGALLMIPMLLAGRTPVPEGEVRVTALDVGQGTAVLVETKAHALLYDTGPGYPSGASAGGQVIVPWLRAMGVRRLDALMVSHEDADHAGGVREVLAAVPVGRRLTGAPLDHGLLIGSAPTKGGVASNAAPWQPCEAGAAWTWNGVRFVILHPSVSDLGSARLASNARSCVLRVATAHRSLLLTGDIGVREEQGLIAAVPPEDLRADVLLVPHHGSGTSSGAAFLRAVQPEAAVFQLGYGNRYRHPRDDVWRRYGRQGIARYRTDETGAVSIVTAGPRLAISSFRQRERRYWRDAPAAPR
ncbi:competence protein ComEC [Cupriavidus sp. OV038]|uniref:DNA internalization-related competence protein ComEC/Rec2 n=1 Tax=unclassified Cupriavidus TaxID=2640874 RepID=UPI0008DFBC04|nr:MULTISPECIES: DNA internalization-related competence protein ComEC/Rec2 [unclassified Cupriavidus]SFB98003.1 competence protein ComEC [Cupriavidus sp. OV038]SFO93176.1 competence protein ComEC [Cupriavidus sp. OV096]